MPQIATKEFGPLYDGTNELYVEEVSQSLCGSNCISWSPDGAQLAFGSREGIEVINLDGRNRRTVVDMTSWERVRVRDISWSPDGTRLLFLLHYDSNGDESFTDADNSPIYLVNADGSNLRQLTNDSLAYEAPFWTPDGQQVACTATKTYDVPVNNEGSVHMVRTLHKELLMIDINSRDSQRVWGIIPVIDQRVHPWDQGRFPPRNGVFDR
jgi:Tol biopolymer transport system component